MSALITAGKNLFQQYGNKNSIGVEMCVQAGYNYEKAFENTAALVREIMRRRGFRWKESIVIMTSAANTVRARS